MLGHELEKAFADPSKYEVFLWDREEMDIADQEDVLKKIGEAAPDVIINAAAYTAVDRAENEEELVYRINGYALGHLATVAKALGALLVHFSTDYVFDGENHLGYKEDHSDRKPATVYGKSKKLGEKMIEDISPEHYIIRTQWLFGTSGKNFIETMLKLAGEGEEIRVVNDQFGSPTHARDLAETVRSMVEERRPSGIYHVTNSGVTNWYDFARLIFKLAELNPKVIPVKSEEFIAAAKRPTYSMLINTKLPPLRSHEEALRDYLIETGRIKR